MIKDYYDKFDPNKGYEKILFRAGKGLQSRELNDLQSQSQHQIKGIADVILKDGDLVSGGEVVIEHDKANALIQDGEVYINGLVRKIPKTQLFISLTESIDIGVWLTYETITEEEDPSLRDPAIDAINFDEPGGARLKQNCQWGLKSDALAQEDAFYPVHRIEQGVLIIKQPPPQLDAVTQALARYDREANGGSYVVDGMALSYRGMNAQKQSFSLAEGKAHIEGYEVSFATARNLMFDYNPDIGEVKEEPKTFRADSTGNMRIDTDFFPVKEIEEVNVTVERKVKLTRGQLSGGDDLLPDNSVLEIISVKQNDLTFSLGEDFIFLRNHISWQLNGQEPDIGSQYDIVYRYRKQLQVEFDERGYTLNEAVVEEGKIVENALITTDYTWLRPRVDLIVLDRFGQFQRIKGQAAHQLPVAPNAPANHLAIAQVSQTWFIDTAPDIENLAVRAVSMSELEKMQNQISDLYQLLAIERLRNDANSEDATSKFGVFVDPFLDDDMRDAGIEQSAAIVDGELTLPLNADIAELTLPNQNTLTLPYALENLLVQEMQTGSMRVNPYQAFEPVPASVSLTPSVDHWTQTNTRWTSTITQRFWWARFSWWRNRTVFNTRVEAVNRQTTNAQFLRSRWVHFSIQGFGPGESLNTVTFDGVSVTPEAQ